MLLEFASVTPSHDERITSYVIHFKLYLSELQVVAFLCQKRIILSSPLFGLDLDQQGEHNGSTSTADECLVLEPSRVFIIRRGSEFPQTVLKTLLPNSSLSKCAKHHLYDVNIILKYRTRMPYMMFECCFMIPSLIASNTLL